MRHQITLQTHIKPAGQTLGSQPAALPRAVGTAWVRCKRRDDVSVLDDFRLSGSSRVLFPHANRARVSNAPLEAVILNTAGGVTGGDRFETTAEARVGSHLTLTTQAAERIYRSVDQSPGKVTTHLTLEDNARLDWLPQETILFEGAALQRRLTINMATSARFLMVEPLIFGRTAMGETIHNAHFSDHVTIRRNDALLFADRVHLSDDAQAQLDRRAIAGGARAMATLLLAAPDAGRFLEPLRSLLPTTGGASLIRDGLLFARLLAKDGHLLRQSLIPALTLLHGASLPRTWML